MASVVFVVAQTTTAPTSAGCPGTSRAPPLVRLAPSAQPSGLRASLPPPCIPPLRLRVAACKLGVKGRRVGRWGGSNATRRREARGGWAVTPSLNAGWHAVRTPHALPHFACALLPASSGVGASPWGARVAATTPRGRGAAPERGLASRRRLRRPSCLDCTWALLPASWEVGASPSIYYLYIIRIVNGFTTNLLFNYVEAPRLPPNAGWHAVRPPPCLPPLCLRVAA